MSETDKDVSSSAAKVTPAQNDSVEQSQQVSIPEVSADIDDLEDAVEEIGLESISSTTKEVTPTVKTSVEEKKRTNWQQVTNPPVMTERITTSPSEINPDDGLVAFPSFSREKLLRVWVDSLAAEKNPTEAGKRWLAVLQESLNVIPPTGSKQNTAEYDTLLDRVDSEFRQFLRTEKSRLGYIEPKFNENDNTPLTGERALLKIRAMMGQGAFISIPLFHSGFWLTIKAPQDSDYLELRQQEADDKIQLGRDAFGFIFGSNSAYTFERYFEFIISNLYKTNLKDYSNLADKILVTDLNIILWGLAKLMYPNGFHHIRSLLTPEGQISKAFVTGLVDVKKMLWVDNKAFTSQQKAHMESRAEASVSWDSVELYRKNFPMHTGRIVPIHLDKDDSEKVLVSIELGVPTVAEYFKSSRKWIDELQNIVEKSITSSTDFDTRNRLMATQSTASALRKHAHWVKAVHIYPDTDNTQIITDRDTIDSIIAQYGSDPDCVERYEAAIKQFNDDVTYAIIGIPESDGKGSGLQQFPNIIPIDVLATFFTLLQQLYSKILSR